VIRNFHDRRIDREPPVTLRKSLALSSDQFLVVVVGNCKPGMAIREALDAMTDLPARVHLAFVGRSYDQLLIHVRRKQLQDRVHIVGPVKPHELVPFIKSADASLLLYYSRSANYKNCLPNGFFQAIAAGVPILYPRLPEIQAIAKKYEIGVPIDPLVPKSIGSAVIELTQDPERMARYRKNLIAAAGDLAWEEEELILKKLISGILQNR
jgi:glycosyltransferase involved in cell wall biosynthesis